MDEGAIDLTALPERIHDLVDHWAAETPDAPALIDHDGQTLTYAELRDAVSVMAAALADAGIRGGDRVLIVNENSAATAAALFAASQLDAWAVLVNARLAPIEIDRICQHARPRAIAFTHAVSQDAAAHADRYHAGVSMMTVAGPVRIAAGLPATPEPVATSNASQVAAVIYTSGTTGNPKGVMLTHRNLLFTASVSGRLRRIGSSDFVIQLVPIAHVFGLASVLLCTITAGARIVLVPRFDAARLADSLRSGITVLQGVPAMYAKLLEHLESSGRPLHAPRLRYISAGGSPLDIDWKRSIERRFGLPLNNGYGLTECSSNVAMTRVESPRDDDSIGLPLPGVDVRFVGADDTDVPDGQIGESWIRGPNVMQGYYRDDPATRAAVTGDGWFRTGDLGCRRKDGYLFIVGRLKELIIRSGFNVYPAEVETALNAHPDVVQSAVIGRRADGNEEVIAFIEAKAGSGLQASTLRDHARERLAAYKRPQHIFIVDRIPASPTGKILKATLAPLAERLIAEGKSVG
jgi:long-chain acyl-CoA synthetase